MATDRARPSTDILIPTKIVWVSVGRYFDGCALESKVLSNRSSSEPERVLITSLSSESAVLSAENKRIALEVCGLQESPHMLTDTLFCRFTCFGDLGCSLFRLIIAGAVSHVYSLPEAEKQTWIQGQPTSTGNTVGSGSTTARAEERAPKTFASAPSHSPAACFRKTLTWYAYELPTNLI